MSRRSWFSKLADRATEDDDLLAQQGVLGEQFRSRPGHISARTSRQPRRCTRGLGDSLEQVTDCLDPTDHLLLHGSDDIRKHGFDLPLGCAERSQPSDRIRVK
jgi:hypothetical protein